MSDDLYLPRHFALNPQEYTSNLLKIIHGTQSTQPGNQGQKSQPKPQRPQSVVKKTTPKKRIDVNALNAAHGLPKDLNQNFSKWFYGDIEKLKSRPAPIAGLHLSPIQSKTGLRLGPNNFKFLSQDLGEQLKTEPIGIVKTCNISVSDKTTEPNPAISLILETKSTVVDRRPALRKQKQNSTSADKHRTDCLIAIEEDCDDISDKEDGWTTNDPKFIRNFIEPVQQSSSVMNSTSELNETRFNLILENLESCDNILNQLNSLDNLSNSINTENIPNLLGLSSKINNESQPCLLRGPNYNNLLRHDQLLHSIAQLLPSLSEAVEDRSRFDEAIQLLGQITDFNDNYGTQIPIINHIFRKSEELRDKLVSNLSDGLARPTGCSVNEVSSIVHSLFQCGNFTNRDLKLKYLQARDDWFNNRCEDSGASFDDVVQVHCDGLPLIYNEYKSIFCAPDIPADDAEHSKLINSDPLGEDGAIINSWLLVKTSIFISSLEVYLRSIHQSGNQTPTMLSDTIQKCFELSDQLASIGFDFSARLKPLFLKAISTEVRASIERATEKFETNFTSTVSKSIESLLLPIDDEILRISNMRPEERLPESIEHYPVFKIYCLHILNSLRWLHICKDCLSPVSLCLDTYEVLNASLTRTTKALATILNLDSNSRHPILTKIAISYITEVLPFVSKYCEVLFPEKVILNTMGLSKADYKSILASSPECLKDTRLNHRQIAEPLKSTMPALLQTIQ